MIKTIHAVSLSDLLKRAIISGLVVYAGVATYLLLKLDPKPILIGVDSYGTRIIQTADDRLIRTERQNFLKRFIQGFYAYDSLSFEKKVSESGDLMSADLWDKKKTEFQSLSARLKDSEISQRVEISDLREIDPTTYQADLVLTVKNRLQETKAKLRVDLTVRGVRRSESNPYPYEVVNYDEAEIL